ncbi:Calcyclin-binding protein-like [Homarus americanus]|uniref:Calcyclin-binding protein n=1 Tax=Homarus americanus TaxID=6706 RepID=A0A8J5N589_HOMAM|nr:Calcyclin-binding protein-like [Homarus americanus]
MSNKIEEMLKDVEELRTLVASATRKRIQDLLSQELRKMEIECTLTAWDESDKFMKIYISLKNVQGLEKDAITTTFSKRGVQVMVKELDGKNYDLNITNLAKNINPDASYHKVKTDMLVVLLSKSEQGKWTGVTAEDVRASEARKPKMSSDDPNAGMMDLMKQMYDDGDDKMKQTLRGGGNEMTMPGMDNLNL